MCYTVLIWTWILLTLGLTYCYNHFNWPKPVHYVPTDKINTSICIRWILKVKICIRWMRMIRFVPSLVSREKPGFQVLMYIQTMFENDFVSFVVVLMYKACRRFIFMCCIIYIDIGINLVCQMSGYLHCTVVICDTKHVVARTMYRLSSVLSLQYPCFWCTCSWTCLHFVA